MLSPGVIEYREVSVPHLIKGDQILLRIEKIGICGSDIHVNHGLHPSTPYPVVQGHEYSATVMAVGSDVKGIEVGMKATGRPQLVCGECAPCKRGQYNVCQNLKVQGFQADGVAQDLFVIDQDRIVIIPDNVDLMQGAMIEPCAVGAHATSRIENIKDKNVVISGAGTIGNLVAQFAKIRGAAKVAISDFSTYRLEVAKKCGIEYTIDLKSETFQEGVNRAFGKEGFQIGFEAAGVESSLTNIISNVEKGGDVVILGVYSKNPVVNMFHVGEHELKLTGTMMYLHKDYLEAVEMISKRGIILEPLISKVFPFSEYAAAYKYIDTEGDKSMKVIIDLENEGNYE